MAYLRRRQNQLPLLYYQFNHNHNHDDDDDDDDVDDDDDDDDTKQTCFQRLLGSSISRLTITKDFHGFYQLFYRNANITPSNRPEMPPSKSLLSQYS